MEANDLMKTFPTTDVRAMGRKLDGSDGSPALYINLTLARPPTSWGNSSFQKFVEQSSHKVMGRRQMV